MALARLIPRHRQDAQKACDAMRLLNWHLKTEDGYSFEAYALKEAFIKALYFNDAPRFRCAARDFGRVGYLFTVGDTSYLWHLPRVVFPVELLEVVPFAPRAVAKPVLPLSPQAVRCCMATVAQWLEAVQS